MNFIDTAERGKYQSASNVNLVPYVLWTKQKGVHFEIITQKPKNELGLSNWREALKKRGKRGEALKKR